MSSLIILSIFDGSKYLGEEGQNFGVAAIIALIAILIVFVILALLIGAIKIMQLCFKGASKKQEEKVENSVKEESPKNTNIEDDDMMAAVLVATIDYANETKKDVRLKSVKRIG